MRTRFESWRSSRNLDLHPGINFSKLEIGGDVGGLIFAAGSVVAVLIGLPWIAPMYVASMALGGVLAVLLVEWHQYHPSR